MFMVIGPRFWSFSGRDIAPLTAEIRRGSEIHRLGAEIGVSPLGGGGNRMRHFRLDG
jgi:hypothetical protein